jgi:CRISPR/Cas system CSM-associated protein Csm3 (group 7 of RAMP superfamily)
MNETKIPRLFTAEGEEINANPPPAAITQPEGLNGWQTEVIWNQRSFIYDTFLTKQHNNPCYREI